MARTSKIKIWADGFGRWHVTVADTGTVSAQRQRARRAIAAQLWARRVEGACRPTVRLSVAPEPVDGVREWVES